MKMQIVLNILTAIIGLIFLVCLIVARDSDLPFASYVWAIFFILLSAASIFYSNQSENNKLMISVAPVILVATLAIPILINPYFLLTSFYAAPGALLEKGIAVASEIASAMLSGNTHDERILTFKKRFSVVYTCSKKRSGVVERFLVKNENKNALINIEFSRTDFWAKPVGLIQGDTLMSYYETESDEFHKLSLEKCYDSNGKSVLDHYRIVTNENKEGYAAYDIQMYDTAYHAPNDIGYLSWESDRGTFFQLFNFATSSDIVEKINTELRNIKPDVKLCLKRRGMCQISAPPNFLNVRVEDGGNCDDQNQNFPEYYMGLVFNLKTGSRIAFSELFKDYEKDQKKIKEIFQRYLQKRSGELKQLEFKNTFSHYIETFSKKDDSSFSFTIDQYQKNEHPYISIYPMPGQGLPNHGIFLTTLSVTLFRDYLKGEWGLIK